MRRAGNLFTMTANLLRKSIWLLIVLVPLLALSSTEDRPAVVRVVQVDGVINPVVAEFITTELERANEEQARAFLIEIDTPGGLDTAMRTIIKGILGSEIPVVVYVYPSGARAASAGALITLAADFAAMAPGTNLGAAHPVSIGGGGGGGQDKVMMDKVVQDAVAYSRSIAEKRGRNLEWAEKVVRESISTPASEALSLKVIDLIVEDEGALLKALEGKRYLRDGKERTLKVADAFLVRSEMNWRQRTLDVISNPTVAYLLLMLGMLGIFFEISQPGVILPGALGAIALLLAFYSFQTLPVNYAGVLLILLAIVLFILEVKVTSFGMLTVGGILSMALGSLMLIESSEPYLQISRAVIFATVAVTAGFFSLVVYYVLRTHRTRFVSGAEGISGERGTAVTEIHREGRIFVHGEYWDAFSEEPIPEGSPVEVVSMEQGMRLKVRRVS